MIIVFSQIVDVEQSKAFISEHLVLGSVGSISTFAIHGLTFIPLPAVVLTTLGNTLAATVEYILGGSIGQAADFEQKKNKLPFGLSKLPIDSIPLLLIGRMIPALWHKIMSIAAGLYHVPYYRYLWMNNCFHFSCGLCPFSFWRRIALFFIIRLTLISQCFIDITVQSIDIQGEK